MRFLLDENVSQSIAPALQALGEPDEFYSHVLEEAGRPKLTDDEVVELCRTGNFDVLITINVRDFGARLHYYASLRDRGIHVVVVRTGKEQPDLHQQMAMVCGQFDAVRRILSRAAGPALVKVTRTSAHERTLDELINEQTGLP